jgi:D-3-phosphoglycerate dehydrogenase
MMMIANDDQAGVIGEVGTILGQHGVYIASFALGRRDAGAVGVVNVDAEETPPERLAAALDAIQRVPGVREAWLIRL